MWECHAPFQGKKVHQQRYSSIYSNSSAPSFLLFYTPDSHVKSFTGIFSCGACGYTWWLDKWGSALANVHCFPQLTYRICYKMQRKAINLPSAAEISTLPKTLLLSAPLTMTFRRARCNSFCGRNFTTFTSRIIPTLSELILNINPRMEKPILM